MTAVHRFAYGVSSAGKWGPMRRRVLAVSLIVLMLSPGCLAYRRFQNYTRDATQPRIALQGDSMMGQTHVEIRQRLEQSSSWWSGTNAIGAATIADLRANQGVVIGWPDLAPDATVLFIGTIDTHFCHNAPHCDLATWTPTNLGGLVSNLEAAGVGCRIAITLAYEPAPGATPVNDEIWRLHAQGTVTAVADWYTHSQGHPEYFYDPVGHMTQAGQNALAALVESVVLASCGDGT